MISQKSQALLLREAQTNLRSAATWLGRTEQEEAPEVAARCLAEAVQMIADALGDTDARRDFLQTVEDAASFARL